MANDENNGFSDRFDNIISAGQLAKLKIYQDYINRIGQGEKLKLAEKKHFDELDRLFNELAGSDKPKENFTRQEVAEKLGISLQQVKWHTTRKNLIRNEDGTYNIKALTEWEEKYKSLKLANSVLGSETNKSEAKLKINQLIRELDHCIVQLAE